jgi:predicted nucleic acid-binding Zn ribbon protein
MPQLDYKCDKCGETKETVQLGEIKSPECCNTPMRRLFGLPALIKIKGQGYPSRRKWMDNWTPSSPTFSTGSLHGESY